MCGRRGDGEGEMVMAIMAAKTFLAWHWALTAASEGLRGHLPIVMRGCGGGPVAVMRRALRRPLLIGSPTVLRRGLARCGLSPFFR